VVFQPGEKKGQVEALVAVQEQPITRWTLGLDNSGNEATGNYRTSLAFQHANVNDADAVLGLRLLTSPTDPERVSIVSATYRVPLYAQKVFWEWSALSSNTVNAPNQTPAGELRFSGQGNSFGGRALWTLPSLSEFKQQASIGLESRQYKNTCTLGSFGTAGCGSAAASVDVFPLTLGYALQQSGVMSATLQWIGNMQVDNAGNSGAYNAARAGAVSDYQLMRFNSLGRLPLGRALELSWRADAQWSQQALVSAEQFGVGGASSVRGYPERVLSGDSGALVSLEFDMPLGQDAATGGADTSMQLSGYLDAAMVRNERDTACLAGLSNCSLWGSGMGLAIRYGKHLTSRMDLARAGQMVNTTQAGDWRLHFSVNYQY
jgi:hemolysin activation/secretion protein